MPSITLTHRGSSLTAGDYSLLNNDWGTPSNLTDTPGANSSFVVADASSPNSNVTINWTFPNYTPPSYVWAYPEVYWGGQDGLQVPSLSTKLSNLKSLDVTYSVGATSSNSDVLLEVWTKNAAGQLTNEIAVNVYGWGNGPGSIYSDSHITAVEKTNTAGGGGGQATWNFVTLRTTTDMLQGTISFSDIIADLVRKGVVNGNDYISGLELGSEMTRGSGQLQINTFNVYESLISTHTITKTGGAANDIFDITTNNNYVIEGGGGLNTVRIHSPAAAVGISTTQNGHLSVSGAQYGSIDLHNVQRLQLADQTLALDVNGDAGQVYRLYQAAFNRVPDKGGLGDWIYGMDNGMSLLQVSAGFVGSPEFQSHYGQDPTDSDVVTHFYQNVLHRAPEQAGYDYWMNQLQSGMQTRTQILTGFSESPENQAQVIGMIQHGIEYTQHAV